jgi:hypothetical protein
MSVRDACPGCGSTQFKKNGHIRSGKQNHRCKACGRQFVASAEDRIIADEQRTLVEHLLRERISLHGICRAVGVSLTWLLHFMVECFAACPDHLHVQRPAGPAQSFAHQDVTTAKSAMNQAVRKSFRRRCQLLDEPIQPPHDVAYASLNKSSL